MIFKDNPLVTIVTPAYNQAEFLDETIASVLAQDYPHIEYIVLDDGSTDHTKTVLQKYQVKFHIESQQNMGQASTLNKGWDIARGEIFGYLSADDILYPGAITKLVAALQADASIAVVYPDCHLIDPASIIIKKNVCRQFDHENLVVEQECFIGPGALFRKDSYLKAGGWRPDLKLAPDREFWMRVGLNGGFKMLEEPLAGYRMHPKSISFYEKRPEIAMEYLRVMDDFYARKDLAQCLILRKDEAYSHALLVIARSHLRSGDLTGGYKKYREAIARYPRHHSLRTILSLLRTSVSKPLRRLIWGVQSLLPKAKI